MCTQILFNTRRHPLRHRKLVRDVWQQVFVDIGVIQDNLPFVEQRSSYWSTVLGFAGYEALMNDRHVSPTWP